MSPDILEVFRQHSFLASVIAGFAIAAAIQLLSLPKRKPIVTVTIAAFLLSSITEIFATSLFVMIMTFIIGPPGWPHPSERWLTHFMGGMGVMPILGLFFFLLGIALVGWLRSKLLGLLTTTSALLAAILFVQVLRSMALDTIWP